MVIRLPTRNETTRMKESTKYRMFRWMTLVVFLLCSTLLIVDKSIYLNLVYRPSLEELEDHHNLLLVALDTGAPPVNSTLGEVININQSIALAFSAREKKYDCSEESQPFHFDSLKAALMTRHTTPGSLMLWQICSETRDPSGKMIPNTADCIISEFIPIPQPSKVETFTWFTWTPTQPVQVNADGIYWIVVSSDAATDERSLVWIDSDKGKDPWGTAFSNGDDTWIRDRDGSQSVPSLRVILR
ncbi:hypothetical protein BC943DRAFT_323239 [Umbelopsis sp. AD052]|nr:hypothetical protein BC943DRAFT_323239 [Umbelopsis sp. AD052]